MNIESPLNQKKNKFIIKDKLNISKAISDAIYYSSLVDLSEVVMIWAVDDGIHSYIGNCTNLKDLLVFNFNKDFDLIKIFCSKKKTMVLYSSLYAQDALPLISYLVSKNIKFTPIGGYDVGGYIYDDRVAKETIEESYVSQSAEGYGKFHDPGTIYDFVNIMQAINYTKHLNGAIVEVGCFRGSSGGVMLDYANNKGISNKDFYFFDIFDGFNYPEAINSADWIWAGTHETEGIESVTDRLIKKSGKNNVFVQKLNIITDEISPDILKIALLNIDLDLYEAVKAAFCRLANNVIPGGIIICEDAGHTPGLIGARLALDEFINSPLGRKFTPVHMESGQVFLIRYTE